MERERLSQRFIPLYFVSIELSYRILIIEIHKKSGECYEQVFKDTFLDSHKKEEH